jgi:hypothetical protein
VAGVLGLYPYSATRHSAFLITILVAGISYPLGRLAGRRLWPVLLGVVLLMPVWYARYGQYGAGWFIGRNDVRRALMPEAMDYVRRVAAPGDVIFSDIETQYMLKRYLPGRCSAAAEHSPAGFTEYAMGGYQLVCPAFIWQFWPTGFGDQFHALAESYGLKYGDTICVPSAGWGRHLADRLAWELQVSYPLLRTFGTHISVFGVPVGSEVTSETLARRTAAAQEALDSLARAFGRTGGTGLTSLFWPGPHLTDAARRACRGFGVPVFTYAEAYRTALAGLCGFEDLMPALAFWVVGTRERHPSFMRYMDEAADYAAGGYRFTLIAVDPSGPVVAYLVEPDRAEP